MAVGIRSYRNREKKLFENSEETGFYSDDN